MRRRALRKTAPFLAAVVLLAGLAWWAGVLDRSARLTTRGAPEPPPYEYRGAIHCHTDASDGRISFQAAARIAAAIGLDFLIVTDHDTLEGLTSEGVYGPCRVLAGMEISTDDGHLLGLGIPKTAYRLGGSGEQTVEAIRRLGGLSIIPHPVNDRFSWKGPAHVRADGIEIFNGDSAWRNASPWKVFLALPATLLNPGRSFIRIMDPPVRELSRWDASLQAGPSIGLAGADTHGGITVLGMTVPFPAYDDSLAMFVTHILTDRPLGRSFQEDKTIILNALSKASCYLSVAPLGDAAGFRFYGGPDQDPRAAGPGGSLTTEEPVGLHAEIDASRPVRLVLLSNGTPVKEVSGRRLEVLNARPGVYRVEVYAGERGSLAGRLPWIVSNPIRLNSPPRAPQPSVPASCGEQTPLESFDAPGPCAYRLEADRITLEHTGPIEITHPGAQGTSGCLQLSFALPATDDPKADHFWALSDRTARDLSGAHGLGFYVRSDNVLRLKLQVRDEDPSGQEEAEWFSTSFFTTPSWQRVIIPFDRLRCVSRGRDGILDVSKIKGIFFIGDLSVLNPGAAGTVWIDEITACSLAR